MISLGSVAILAIVSALSITLIGSLIIAALLLLYKHLYSRAASTSGKPCSTKDASSFSWDSVVVYQSEGGEHDNQTFDRSAIQVATSHDAFDHVNRCAERTFPTHSIMRATSFKDVRPVTMGIGDVVLPQDNTRVFENEGDFSMASLSTLVSDCPSDCSIVLTPVGFALPATRDNGQELYI